MTTSRPTSAKIIQHAEGLGLPNADSVRKRAREIALIDGHSSVSNEDWRQAKRELHGGHQTNSGQNEFERTVAFSNVGHHVENLRPDGVNIGEELLAEGMDEALHEQMLASRVEESAEDDVEE